MPPEFKISPSRKEESFLPCIQIPNPKEYPCTRLHSSWPRGKSKKQAHIIIDRAQKPPE